SALGVEAAMKSDGDVAGAITLLQRAVEEARAAIGQMLNRS
ncbi:MAG TPA: histidine kinase, partial [Afipia sp.]|nr:histidine kinase [Afipia sp.]